ncbi:hypothetical protein [Cnuella takakiae]|uniref:hypothetical protein n=1 Tax=Cnuella takakiae TaxID=1302690 RepID=UPI00373FD4C9
MVGPFGSSVVLGWPCLGLGIMIFWVFFVSLQRGLVVWKMKWITLGVSLIWFINSLRLTLLFIALESEWNLGMVDHHKLFNRSAYLIILVLMYFLQENSKTLKKRSESSY